MISLNNPFGFGEDPLTALARPAARRAPSALPDVPPEDQDGILGSALEESLGGLAYIGKLLDKPGRAVRGGIDMLTGGDTPVSELLAALPLSDTLGLTRERDSISGAQLNANLGLTTPGDDSLWNLGAGFATEVLTDPLTYTGVGALKSVARPVARAGELPKGLANKMRGFVTTEDTLTQAAQAAGSTRPQDFLAPLAGREATARDVLTTAQQQAARAAGTPVNPGDDLIDLISTGLPGSDIPFAAIDRGGLRFGVPFVGETGRIPLGSLPERLAGGIDSVVGGIAATAPVRAIRAAIDPSVKGATSAAGQQLAEGFGPLVNQFDVPVREDALRLLNELRPVYDTAVANDQGSAFTDALRLLTESDPAKWAALQNPTPALLENADAVSRMSVPANLPSQADRARDMLTRQVGLSAPDVAKVEKSAAELSTLSKRFLDLEKETGLAGTELMDNMIGYFTRSANVRPKGPGESNWSFLRRATQEFSAQHASQGQRNELFRDVPYGTSQIEEWVANAPTLQGQTPIQRQGYFLEQLTGTANPPAQIMVGGKMVANPAYKQAEELSKWIGTVSPEYAAQGVKYFSGDPFADLMLRGRRSATARGSAEAVYEGATKFAEPVSNFVARNDQNFVTIDELLRRTGLTAQDPATGLAVSKGILGTRTGINHNNFGDYAVPADLAADMVNFGKAFTSPRELTPVLQAWDSVSNLFKTGVTSLFPAFHARNLMSGLFQMWRGGALSPAALGDAYTFTRGGGLAKHLPGMDPARSATDQLTEELVANNVALTQGSGVGADWGAGKLQARPAKDPIAMPPTPEASGQSLAVDLLSQAKAAVPRTRAQANPLNTAGVRADTDVFAPIAEARKVQAGIDDFTRVAHYLGLRGQGFDPARAAIEVKKYQLDYSNLTPTERNILRRVAPWYSFSRRSLPNILEDVATKPGKLAGSTRLVAGVREPYDFVPAYVAEGASVPIPGAPDGQQRYISSFGLPMEDEALKTLGSLAQGDVTRSVQSLLGMTMPQVKTPLEYAFGTQLYSGRRLEDLKPAAGVSSFADLLGAGNEERNRVLTQVVNNTPLSRASSSIDKLLDDRKGTISTGINLLTGVRVSDVDQERQRDIAARKLLSEQLRGRPGVRVAESLYVPADRLGELTPSQQALYVTYKSADKRVRERAQEDKKKREAAAQR